MSQKYIIKNCPAYIHRPLSTHDRVCLLGDKVKPNHKELYVYCKDCTDCLLKKIVEKCKEAQEIMDKEQYYEDDFDTFNGESIMAETIMDMLDIEECE